MIRNEGIKTGGYNFIAVMVTATLMLIVTMLVKAKVRVGGEVLADVVLVALLVEAAGVGGGAKKS